MSILLSGLAFAMPSLAQSNSTALEGWKLDDNSRSSWDILWTCLSTIFACTWTALHLSVPRASRSDGQNIMRKIVAWIFATLAPEFMAGTASQELWVAWVVTKRCNATFKEVEQKTTTSDGSSPHSGTPRWNLIHGFCIYMHGAVLQTSDRHCFPVQYQHVGLLIREGVLKPHHLRAPEIKDRAKADSLAKAFTLLQSFWVTCNIIARRAYDLPITPIEISVVAYVACVAFTYGTWWHKPRDMTTPITIPLPYNRDSEEMPLGLRHLTDSKPDLWFRFPEYDKQGHVHGVIVECFFIVANIVVTCFKPSRWKSILKNEQMLIAPIDASTSEAPSVVAKKPREDEKSIPKTKSSGLKPPVNHELEEEKGFDDTFIGNIYGATFFIFISVVFCGIHVAAWSFVFPTKAEQITWRVFSLVALGMVLPGAVGFFYMLYRGYQESEDKQFYSPGEKHLQASRLFWIIWMAIYSTARWGNLILMFVSLRELPAGSYTSIEWLSSIPHI